MPLVVERELALERLKRICDQHFFSVRERGLDMFTAAQPLGGRSAARRNVSLLRQDSAYNDCHYIPWTGRDLRRIPLQFVLPSGAPCLDSWAPLAPAMSFELFKVVLATPSAPQREATVSQLFLGSLHPSTARRSRTSFLTTRTPFSPPTRLLASATAAWRAPLDHPPQEPSPLQCSRNHLHFRPRSRSPSPGPASAQATKATVQFNLFGGTVLRLGTARHHDKLLDGIDSLDQIGCFALTELGFGNNAVEMQTTATYVESSDEWIIHTPTTLAQKCAPSHTHHNPLFQHTHKSLRSLPPPAAASVQGACSEPLPAPPSLVPFLCTGTGSQTAPCTLTGCDSAACARAHTHTHTTTS